VEPISVQVSPLVAASKIKSSIKNTNITFLVPYAISLASIASLTDTIEAWPEGKSIAFTEKSVSQKGYKAEQAPREAIPTVRSAGTYIDNFVTC